MLLLVRPQPRRYSYTFLAILLFLGFWLKFNVHALFGYEYKEPVGAFDGSGEAWNKALVTAAFGALGVSSARLLQLALTRGRLSADARQRSAFSSPSPSFYVHYRTYLWISTAVTAIAVYSTNALFDWYQIGVEAQVALPARANVALSWAVKLGIPLWLATLVFWELRLTTEHVGRLLLAPIADAMAATTTSLSRGLYLFRLLPYLAVGFDYRANLNRLISPVRQVGLITLVVLGFVCALVAVSVLRLVVYPNDTQVSVAVVPAVPISADALDETRVGFAIDEVTGLAIDRWTGMEGVLAVTASGEQSPELLMRAIEESPDEGESSIYQRIAGAEEIYESRTDYTFLTLPGLVAVLSLAGYLPLTALGVMIVVSALLALEGCLARYNANPLMASVAGMGMAVEVSLVAFPYLLGVFFILLVASVAAISWLQARLESAGSEVPPHARPRGVDDSP